MTTPNFSEALRTIRAHVDPTRPPTNRPGLTETVRAIADAFESLQPAADGPHDWDGNAGDGSYQPRCKKCGALREPMDSSDRGCPGKPPAEKRGEAPSPLPEVLPVGTMVDGVLFGMPRLDAPARLGGNLYKCDNGGYFTPSQVDWDDYHRTPSPSPSREGEAVPQSLPEYRREVGEPWRGELLVYLQWTDGDRLSGIATEGDIAAVLKAMPEERRTALLREFYYDLYSVFQERLTKSVKRAEAAEERAAKKTQECADAWESSRLEREGRVMAENRVQFWQANHTALAKELEAVEKERDEARARVTAAVEWVRAESSPTAFLRFLHETSDSEPTPAAPPVDGGDAPTNLLDFANQGGRLESTSRASRQATGTESAARAEYGDDEPSQPETAGRQASRPNHSFGVRIPEWVEPPVRPVVDETAGRQDDGGGEARASASCPVCGKDTPHAHTTEELSEWLSRMVARWRCRPSWFGSSLSRKPTRHHPARAARMLVAQLEALAAELEGAK